MGYNDICLFARILMIRRLHLLTAPDVKMAMSHRRIYWAIVSFTGNYAGKPLGRLSLNLRLITYLFIKYYNS